MSNYDCRKVENAGSTPGLTLYYTRMGARGEEQLYENEARDLCSALARELGGMQSRALSGAQINMLRRALNTENRRMMELRSKVVREERLKKKPDPAQLVFAAELQKTIGANDRLADYLLKGRWSE